VKFECFTCHEVKGEKFPAPDPGKVGPELSAMAGAHPPEYFAEAIINPNAVIDKGRGYEATDGSSKMPSYNDDLTVQELLDLVVYLVNLQPPAGGSRAPTPAPGATAVTRGFAWPAAIPSRVVELAPGGTPSGLTSVGLLRILKRNHGGGAASCVGSASSFLFW